ncbi:hypothetical protein V1511DRAFT_503488 [Dipodascopsis uninucleata]
MAEDDSKVFEELATLEMDFEKAELDILKYSTKLLNPLYKKRKETIKRIPSFWRTVLEQGGEEIDQYVNPQDGELLESILSIELERAEADPRTFTLKFEFEDNDFLEDNVITKTFTYIDKKSDKEEEDSEDITDAAKIKYRSTKSDIKWKAGKNLIRTKAGATPSFFTFFDWENSEDESKQDVFDRAHEVALYIAEDLYPNAVKLFTEATEEEEEDEDEEIDLEDEDDEDDEEEEPPKKRRK